jgi:recombination protein RecA
MAKKITKKEPISDQIRNRAKEEPVEIQTTANKGDFSNVISTGSTLLDLAISGGRVRGGGIPSGILVEIYGPSQSGKTALLAEMCTDTTIKGGNVKFLDPEARLDREYMRIYGMELDKENYHMPDTVNEVFEHILNWEPDPPKKNGINIVATDSLAALSSELELSEKGDKMGMKIAKDFSQGLRKACRLIKRNKFIIACSNQIRQGSSGETTSGGKGIPFYASLRIRIGPPAQNKYLKSVKTINKVKHEKIYGIQSICTVKKSVDDPYRTANVYIVFGLGIDDVRANLAYLKQNTEANAYVAIDKEFGRIDPAIKHIEDNNLELDLKNKVIDLWEEIEETFKVKRKPKRRGI